MYSVWVTDARGVTAITSVYVGTKNDFLRVHSSHLNVSTTGGTDGSVDLTVVGGVVPATFRWSNGATTEDLTGVPKGTYTVVVTDAYGREATTSEIITEAGQNLSPNPKLYLSVSQQNVSAPGKTDGSIDLTIVGGIPPFTIAWQNRENPGTAFSNF